MKKTLLYTLIGAFALAGVVETVPARADAAPATAPRSLEQLRADVRGEAMTSFGRGDVQEVTHHTVRKRHMVRKRRATRQRGVFRSRTMSRIHHRGRSCGKYVGRRCYYTPRLLKPFRQG